MTSVSALHLADQQCPEMQVDQVASITPQPSQGVTEQVCESTQA